MKLISNNKINIFPNLLNYIQSLESQSEITTDRLIQLQQTCGDLTDKVDRLTQEKSTLEDKVYHATRARDEIKYLTDERIRVLEEQLKIAGGDSKR